jgi:AP-2 complex subunit alpha
VGRLPKGSPAGGSWPALLQISTRKAADSQVTSVLLQLSRTARPLVRKKAALCLLRLYRKNRDVINVDGW